MNAKEEQVKAVYKELITVEVAGEKIAGTDMATEEYLHNIQTRLEKKEEFKDSEYSIKNGNTLIVKTKEGYEFAIVGDKVILATDGSGNGNGGGSGSEDGDSGDEGEGGGNKDIPVIKDGEVKFKTIPSYWVNTKVTLEISCLKHPTWDIEYTEDYTSTDWTAYSGKITADSNKTIYTRLRNDVGASENYATHSITNIDKNAPKLTNNSFRIVDGTTSTRKFAVELETQDMESGLSQITWNYKLKSDTRWTKSVTDLYHTMHTKDSGDKSLVKKMHTFDKLKTGTYMVQANIYDVAGNITPTDIIEVTIGSIDDVASEDINQGNLTYSPVGWTNDNVTVNLPTIKDFETRYTTDGSVPSISSKKYDPSNPIVVTKNTRIYYIYTDGINISKYATKEITNIDKDKMAIRTALKESNITTKSFNLSVQVEDEPIALAKRSGLAQIDWYYKLSTSSGEYNVVKDVYKAKYGEQSGERGKTTKTKQLDDLLAGTYLVYVDVHDVAGNITSTKDTPLTIELGRISDIAGEASGSYTPTTWTSGDVKVTLSKTNEFKTMYTDDGSIPNANNPNLKEYIDPFYVSSNAKIQYTYTDGTNISSVGTKNITNIDKTPATVSNFVQTNVTTNSFKLSANIQDGESGIGKVVFYYKNQNDGSYTSKVWSNPNKLTLKEAPATQAGPTSLITVEESFTNLKSGTYECYIQVFNTAGTETSTVSSPISFALGTIPTIGSSSFSPSGWTNGDVTVTLPTSSGFTTRYTINGSMPNLSSTAYSAPFTVSSNGTIKYIYTDGTNINTAGSRAITNIDKKVPTITTALNKTGVTTKGFTLTMSVQDTDTTVANASGLSKIVWYYKLSTASTYASVTTSYTTMNGTTAGSRNVTNATKAIDNLASGTYQAYAEVYDVAGNKTTSSTISITLGSLPTIGSSSFSPSGWTNGNVTVTLPTSSGYTTRYTTNGTAPTKTSTAYSAPFAVSSNCAVKYIYTDGTNINTAGSRAITNIDKKVPTITTALNKTGVTTKGFTLTMSVQDTDTTVANASGLSKIVWYYKLSTASTYTSVTTSYTTMNGTTAGSRNVTSATKAIDNLASGTYNAYAEVYDVAGNKTTSSTISITLGSLPAIGSSSFTPTGWTNGNVTVTLPTSSGYTTRYTINGTAPTKTSTAYSAPFAVSSNCTVKYIYTDGTNINTAGSRAITNIDKTAPTINSALAQSSKSSTSITVTIKVTDSASGLGKIVWYYKKASASSWSSKTSTYTTANSTSSGTTSAVTKTYTFSSLTQGTNYQFYAIIYDVAGNQVSSKSAASPLSITTDNQLVTSISINPSTAQTKNVGETFAVTPTVSPSTANNKNVNWTSSNTSVATVSNTSTASGTAVTVTCKASGTATITATAADGSGKSASITLRVYDKVTITTFTYNSTSINVGETSGNPTKTITGTAKSGPTYSSSNTSIATVNSSTGVVTGKTVGTATITIKYTNYDGTTSQKTCSVTIKSPITYVNCSDITVTGTPPGCAVMVEYSGDGHFADKYGGSSGSEKQLAITFSKTIVSGRRPNGTGGWLDIDGPNDKYNTFINGKTFVYGLSGDGSDIELTMSDGEIIKLRVERSYPYIGPVSKLVWY